MYDPERGFYPNRLPKEDFYTAPELHPAFAGILADEIVFRLAQLASRGVPGPYWVVEMGSGSGRLALDVWEEIQNRHAHWAGNICFVLIERCEGPLLEGIFALAGTGARTMGYAQLEDMPAFSGVFFSNELVDAFPVHLLDKRDGRMWEVYIAETAEDASNGTRERLGEISAPALQKEADRVSGLMQEGDRHAVNLEARRWMAKVARKLQAGTVITIDYGKRFLPGVPNPPRTFSKHTVGDALTAEPGRRDLTASVDFEPLIEEGEKNGLGLNAYMTMGRFLIDRGILNWMRPDSGERNWDGYKDRNQIKMLLHPEGMGERFKVLIQEKTDRKP